MTKRVSVTVNVRSEADCPTCGEGWWLDPADDLGFECDCGTILIVGATDLTAN